jgi:hypothetical protein
MPKNKGLTQKIIAALQPEIDKRIICNKLKFLKSVKYENGTKTLYLIFGAYNNEIDQWQKITYDPKTGYLSFELHYTFI